MEKPQHTEVLFRLGTLDVAGHLGEGAMADVWSASHAPTGTALAVKVLKFEQNSPKYSSALAREVRAMARLPHQNIVAVLGHGTVTREEAARAPGRVIEGAPWFAMEKMEASLRDHMPQDWPSIRETCRQILLGLAHAHARDVVHRDLKPSNVLVRRNDNGFRVAIADFGIAHVRDERDLKSAQLRRVVGTPLYMAPEQYVGRWRDFGPWTDLYALGCMVFEFVCGRPPFTGTSMVALAREHLESPVPRLTARVDVPADLERWISCLLAKAPGDRPACAADALAALPEGSEGLRFGPSAAPDWGAASTMAMDPVDYATTAVFGETLADEVTEVTSGPEIPAAPIPVFPPEIQETLPAVGELAASLFELRPLPVIDHGRLRETLWSDIRRVDADGALARILEGPEAAVGDIIIEQFARTAVEAGAVRWLQCGEREGGGRVLLEGLSRLFGTAGLSSDQIEPLLRTSPLSASWPQSHRNQLAHVLEEASSTTQPRMGTHAARERHAIVRQTLRLLADGRPLLITLVDAHVDDLEVLEGVLAEETAAPILVVGWLSHRVRETIRGWGKEALAELRSHPRSEVTTLEALSAEDSVRLVSRHVRLSAGAFAAAGRADLGPSSTVQLFGHWIRTGLLEWSSEGYQLGEAAKIPTGKEQLWQWRLDELEPSLEPLKVAAVLGRGCFLSDWRQVCEAAGVAGGGHALDTAAERGMGTLTAEQFTFVSEDLRQAVLARVPGRRLREIHRLVADTLQMSLTKTLTHLLHGERYDDVVDTLGGVWTPGFLAETADPAVVAMGEEAIRRLGLGREELRVARIDRHRVRLMRMKGKLDEAVRLNKRVLRVAQRENDWRLEADSFVREGSYLQLRGRLKEAKVSMEAAVACLKPHAYREPRMMGMTLLALGMLEGDLGNLPEAIAHVESARQILAKRAEGDALASALVGLGSLQLRAGRAHEARTALASAVEICETVGSRLMLGRTLNMLGDLEHKADNLAEARSHYRRARRALAFVGGDDVGYPLFNLAMLSFIDGAYSDARELFGEVEEIAKRYGAARLGAAAQTGNLASEAWIGGANDPGDWQEVSAFVERGATGEEMGRLLAGAGDALEERAPGTARVVRELALAVWRRHGRHAEAEALARILGVEETLEEHS